MSGETPTLDWVAHWAADLALGRKPPKSGPQVVPWMPDPSWGPRAVAWVEARIVALCLWRGRHVILERMPPQPPPPPTPGELLASSMTELPALPPTAGGLCPPAKV